MVQIADLMTPLNLACAVDSKYSRPAHLQLLEHEVMKTLYGDWDILVAMAPPRHGKLLSHKTPVWTPDGWRSHGDLQVGDFVYSPEGRAVKVLATGNDGFANRQVVFTSGDRIECHENHEWKVHYRGRSRVVETCEIEKKLHMGSSWNGKPRDRFCIEYEGDLSGKWVSHAVSDVSEIEPTPGRCIQVEGGLYLAGEGLIPTHNSEFMSRRVPAWYHGVYPSKRSIVTSYAVDLARNHSRWVRDQVHKSAPMFGHRGVNPYVAAASDWATMDEGGMLAAGVGGGITGRAADLFIIDDPLKNAEQAISSRIRESQWEWWQTTAFTRMEPGASMLCLATRWHSEDLLGMILKHSIEEMGLKVRELRLPALSEGDGDPLGRPLDAPLWPGRFNQEALFRIRDTLDPYWWNALYQQRLGAYGKNEWPPEYFYGIFAQDDEWPERMALSATALDPSKGKNANKGDYSAIVNTGFKGGYLWVDVDIERRPVPKMMTDLVAFNEVARPTVTGIESVAFQELLAESYIQAQAEVGDYRDEPVLIDNTVNKQIRISRLGLWLRLHRIKVRNNAGGQLLVKQLKEFPNGQHDDANDALEMSIRLLVSLSEDLQELSSGPVSEVLSV